jgi:methionyl-tRNA formyltransferase
LLVKTINGLADGTLKETPQISILNTQYSTLKHAPKIFTETCKIEWNKPTDEIFNLIRGLSPFPAAFSFLKDKMLKIYSGKKEIAKPSVAPGEFITDHKTFLKFAAADGYIHAAELQLEGKRKMLVDEFLRGYRF